jgi:hypothetical protein
MLRRRACVGVSRKERVGGVLNCVVAHFVVCQDHVVDCLLVAVDRCPLVAAPATSWVMFG